MIVEQVAQLLSKELKDNNMSVVEQIRYLSELEEKGIIPPSTPQTFYKYPTTITLNHSISK